MEELLRYFEEAKERLYQETYRRNIGCSERLIKHNIEIKLMSLERWRERLHKQIDKL